MLHFQGTQPMRLSKTMPETGATKKLSNKWPSINTDSGISLMSSDTISRGRVLPGYPTAPSTSSSELMKSDDIRRWVTPTFC